MQSVGTWPRDYGIRSEMTAKGKQSLQQRARERWGACLDEMAKAVRRGDIRIQDIEDKSNIHWIQHYVIQLGQPATRLGFVGSRRQASMRTLMDPFNLGNIDGFLQIPKGAFLSHK